MTKETIDLPLGCLQGGVPDGDARVAKLDRDRVRVVIPPIQLLLDSNISYAAAIEIPPIQLLLDSNISYSAAI